MIEICEALTKAEGCFERASGHAQKEMELEYHRWLDDIERKWDAIFKQAWKLITFRDVRFLISPSMWHNMLEERCDRLDISFRDYCASRIYDLEKKLERAMALQREALLHELNPLFVQLWRQSPEKCRSICELLLERYSLKGKFYDLNNEDVFAKIFMDAVAAEDHRFFWDGTIRIQAIPKNEKLSEYIEKFFAVSFPKIFLIPGPEAFNKSLSIIIREYYFSRMRKTNQPCWESICDKYFVQRVRFVTEVIRRELRCLI